MGKATSGVSGSGALPGNDCDDTLSTVNPGRTDTWYDGVDTNCSGNDDYDRDSDGYVPTTYVGRATTYVSGSGSLPGNDCDDTVSTVNPGRTDTWYDGIDSNCSGNDDYDRDSDGYVRTVDVGKATTYVTGSGGLPGNDCDDGNSAVKPGATETWYDGTDQDCNGLSDYDADLDGYDSDLYSGDDCDDSDPLISPAASEASGVEGEDDDCDEWIDEHLVAEGDLIYTEIMVNSIDSGTEPYEWFEVYNTTSRTLYLDGWFFEDVNASGSNPYNPFFISPDARLEVDAGGYLVFCATSGIPGVTCDYVYRSNSWADSRYGAADNASHQLGNTSGSVRLGLVYGTGATAVPLDTVAYTTSFSYGNGISTELKLSMYNATDNNTAANWCAATNIYITDGSGSHYGTPGAPNSCP